MAGVSRRRIETLAVTSLVLHRVLSFMRPRVLTSPPSGSGRVVCSISSRMTSGSAIRCLRSAMRSPGRPIVSTWIEALERWILPFLGTVTRPDRRLIGAACRLSDLGWFEHPTYRGEHAFHRALRLPAVGIEHEKGCSSRSPFWPAIEGAPKM